MILEYRVPAQFAAMILITLLALRKGGGPEKASGAVILIMFVVGYFYHLLFDEGIVLGSVDLFHAVLDGLVAIALVIIALYANRIYPLCLAGLQLIALSAHLVREMIDAMSPVAYAILFILPSYFQLMALAMGLWAHRQRLRRYGPYKDWRTSPARTAGPI